MKWIILAGLVCNLLGTWMVAIELVLRFKGYAFEVKGITYSGSGPAEKTEDFKRWELKKAYWMWAGLVLITIGVIAQIIAEFC